MKLGWFWVVFPILAFEIIDKLHMIVTMATSLFYILREVLWRHTALPRGQGCPRPEKLMQKNVLKQENLQLSE
eukprot:466117-Amphidinium_carterae.1